MATQAERRTATRAALIDCAHALFVEHGYDTTTTEDVLDAAGVSRGALYHHFPTKEELFAAVFEEVSRSSIDRTLRRAGDGAARKTRAFRRTLHGGGGGGRFDGSGGQRFSGAALAARAVFIGRGELARGLCRLERGAAGDVFGVALVHDRHGGWRG